MHAFCILILIFLFNEIFNFFPFMDYTFTEIVNKMSAREETL